MAGVFRVAEGGVCAAPATKVVSGFGVFGGSRARGYETSLLTGLIHCFPNFLSVMMAGERASKAPATSN